MNCGFAGCGSPKARAESPEALTGCAPSDLEAPRAPSDGLDPLLRAVTPASRRSAERAETVQLATKFHYSVLRCASGTVTPGLPGCSTQVLASKLSRGRNRGGSPRRHSCARS